MQYDGKFCNYIVKRKELHCNVQSLTETLRHNKLGCLVHVSRMPTKQLPHCTRFCEASDGWKMSRSG